MNPQCGKLEILLHADQTRACGMHDMLPAPGLMHLTRGLGPQHWHWPKHWEYGSVVSLESQGVEMTEAERKALRAFRSCAFFAS